VPEMPQLILTIDVEDWPQSTWDRNLPIGRYCASDTEQLLDLIASVSGARATFFVLGKFAEAHPGVVKMIQAAGHEVANHGYSHIEIFHLGRRGFSDDLKRSTDILSNLIGERPRGYGAPDFSIVSETLWALEMLAEDGYIYDSSIFPIDRGRYGIDGWPTNVRRIEMAGGLSIIELPLTVTKWCGRNLPVSGGGYARLLPGRFLRHWLETEAHRRSVPPVFYCHPYELDADEFSRLSLQIPWRIRLHQGLGRRGFAEKMRMLLRCFDCVSVAEIIAKKPALMPHDCRAFPIESRHRPKSRPSGVFN
jgi:polysaccharide deacetylase family protein (PEP-CTERM system associated)